MSQIYKLSPSALSIFKDCPKCFWMEKNLWLKRPRGIFPSLPSGMDLHIKDYFNEYRKKKVLPPELENSGITRLYEDSETIERWRDWKSTNLVYKTKEGNTLSGALDECVMTDDEYSPLDYKTRGGGMTYNPAKYYQTQLDTYGLMLHSVGLKVGRYGYLLYYWPINVKKNGAVKFKVTLYKIELNIDNAKQLFENAIKCLKGTCPEPDGNCEYCGFYLKRIKNDFRKKDVEK